jgi:tetratricopeptide (TPR) repeat protein
MASAEEEIEAPPATRGRGALAWLMCALLLALIGAGPAAIATAQTTEADVYVARAVLDLDEKRYDEALTNLRRALEIEPDHVEALYYTGVVHLAQNRPAEAVAVLERARARSRTDSVIAFQLGLAYFVQQQYAKAQPLLEEVFRADPTLDGLGYYVGFLRYRNRDYQGALRAFRSGRASDPEIQQLTRFYSGLALGFLGLPAQATAEIDQALRLVPGSALTGPAERLRDTIVATRQRERRFAAELRLGVFYDDNVAVVPDPDSGEPQVEVLRDQKRHSTGELFSARLDYVWLRTDAWDATVGYSFFGTYNNDLPSFNVTSHLVTLGLTRKISLGTLPALVGAQYAFDVLFLDDDEFVKRHAVSLFGTVAQGPRHLTQVFARATNKDFRDDALSVPEEDRDAWNWGAGVVHTLRFAEDRHFLRAGYHFDYEDAEGRHYEYRGHRVVVGGQYTLPWKAIRLRADADVHFRNYPATHSLLPTPRPDTRRRRDEEFTAVFRAELPLPHRLTLGAEYQRAVNHSNLEVFEYTRNVFSLILTWSY